MPQLIFIQPDGTEQHVQADIGQSVMQAAVDNLVPGIVADCGGACTCATCHGYVDDSWADRVPPGSEDELGMIDAGCFNVRPTSRLTCQLKVTEALDGLTIRLPPA